MVLTLWMTRGIEIKDTYIDMTAINFDTLEVPVPCQSWMSVTTYVFHGTCESMYHSWIAGWLGFEMFSKVVPCTPSSFWICLNKAERFNPKLRLCQFLKLEKEGWCGNWLFVLTEGSSNEWVAYDPESDICKHHDLILHAVLWALDRQVCLIICSFFYLCRAL